MWSHNFIFLYVVYFCQQSGDTSLHYAAYNDHIDVVMMLHNCGGDIYCENKVSYSFLQQPRVICMITGAQDSPTLCS